MEIIFSSHARLRIQEREVTDAEVHSTLTSPQKLFKKDDTLVAMKIRQNDRLLMVIYRETLEHSFVITIIDTSKVEKYLT